MKNTMVLFLAVLVFSIGCGKTVQNEKTISPKSIYDKAGVTILSPNEPGWTVAQSSESSVVFEKSENEAITIASTRTYPVEGFVRDDNKPSIPEVVDNVQPKRRAQDEDLFTFLEKKKEKEFGQLRMLSIHFKHVQFKGVTCLEYDGEFLDERVPESEFQYFAVKGYIFRHSETDDLVLEVEVSCRAKSRGFPEHMLAVGEAFFENIQF
jgi:hypothetical protein